MVEEQLHELTGYTDLVVLPEMFTTGFCTDQLHLAEDMDGNTVSTLKTWAKKYQLALAGSFIASAQGGRCFNRAFFVSPDGTLSFADKRHLFTIGGEDRYFSPGNEKLIVHYKGFNIFILVCYDIRFPVWSRNVGNEYDLLVYTANFPLRRIDEWDILLKARAVENQAYVCGVNRVGVDGYGIAYNGHSAVYDFKGKELAVASDNESNVVNTEILIEPLWEYRQKFAVWNNADGFEINVK